MKNTTNKAPGKIVTVKEKKIDKRAAEIEKWNDEIKGLENDVTKAGVEAKAKLKHKDDISNLRQKRDETKARLTEIESESSRD